MSYNIEFEGQCPQCGRIYHSKHQDLVICDCWTKCPICGQATQPHTPDLTPRQYGHPEKGEIRVLCTCNNHNPPFFSESKPIEVKLERAT